MTLPCQLCQQEFTYLRGTGRRQKYCSAECRRQALQVGRRLQYHLSAKYGLSLEQYEKMLAAQNHGCAICDSPESGQPQRGGRLHVDHDHTTGRVRGLLCHYCNIALGGYEKTGYMPADFRAYLERVAVAA